MTLVWDPISAETLFVTYTLGQKKGDELNFTVIETELTDVSVVVPAESGVSYTFQLSAVNSFYTIPAPDLRVFFTNSPSAPRNLREDIS